MNRPTKRAPRADGQRNRLKLLTAAANLTGPGSGELSLDRVAKEAGVSIATLYRHFPTRENLLLAISRDDATRHRARAEHLLTEHPPLDALGAWLREMGRYGLTRPGIARAFRAAADDPVNDEVYETTTGALQLLLDAGHAEGTVRSDLTSGDILLALCGLWELKDSPQAQAQCDRLTTLLIDGMKSSR